MRWFALLITACSICAGVGTAKRSAIQHMRDGELPLPGFVRPGEVVQEIHSDRIYLTEWTTSSGGHSMGLYIVSKDGILLGRHAISNVLHPPYGDVSVAVDEHRKTIVLTTIKRLSTRDSGAGHIHVFDWDGKRRGRIEVGRWDSRKVHVAHDYRRVILVSADTPTFELYSTGGRLLGKGKISRRTTANFRDDRPFFQSVVSDDGRFVGVSRYWSIYGETDLAILDFAGRVILDTTLRRKQAVIYEVHGKDALVVLFEQVPGRELGKDLAGYSFSGQPTWKRPNNP